MGSEEVTKVQNLKRKRLGMRLNIKQVLFVSSLVLGLFIYNELIVYRLVIWWNCSYPSLPQVWSLTQFYSFDFSQSRIGVKKVHFQQTHNQGLRQLILKVFWDLRA